MKTFKKSSIKWLLLLFCLPLLTACWEDLPAYDGANITKASFYHRFAGPNKDQLTGEPIMVERELTCTSTIDTTAATVDVAVVVPVAQGSFTEEERAKVTQSKLWGYVQLSTAARIFPESGTQPLGSADDWTKEHKFKVQAANGNTKIWTIRISSFTFAK